jgi:hypothetical protein
MSLVPIKKSTCSASAFDIRQQCRVYQYLKIYIGSLRQLSLQISIFEISSCVLSYFLGFSAKSFLCFHFILQKKTIKTEGLNVPGMTAAVNGTSTLVLKGSLVSFCHVSAQFQCYFCNYKFCKCNCPLGALLFVGTVDTAEMSSKTEQNYHKCG